MATRLTTLILACSLLAVGKSAAASGWAQLAEWAAAGLVSKAADITVDWFRNAVSDDTPPKPVIGVDLGSVEAGTVLTCKDARYEVTKSNKRLPTDNYILNSLFGGTGNAEHDAAREALLADYNNGLALLTGVRGYHMRVGKPWERDPDRVSVDQRGAAQCLEYPAAHGLEKAETLLGFMYLYGLGVPVDERKFFALEKAAADKHYLAAEYNLALAYCYAYGLPNGTDTSARIRNCFDGLSAAALDGFAPASAALTRFKLLGLVQ